MESWKNHGVETMHFFAGDYRSRGSDKSAPPDADAALADPPPPAESAEATGREKARTQARKKPTTAKWTPLPAVECCTEMGSSAKRLPTGESG